MSCSLSTESGRVGVRNWLEEGVLMEYPESAERRVSKSPDVLQRALGNHEARQHVETRRLSCQRG